ncbi:MAG TPA: hypothetical protein ENJ50_03215, partial [Planctomycetaceae bacterium]|nr:hypothetical protein [Planctomycetaceae bacterium]
MGDSFKKVQAGQRLQIPAEAYNAFLDAARAERSRRHNQEQDSTPPFRQADIILVRNDSGATRARFEVLGISSPVVLPTTNLDQFKNQVALAGVVPVVSSHAGKFVVLLEPLEAGAIGRAWVSGVCPARVNVADECHEYADVADGDATALRSVPRGSARILWREGGLGVQWAVVRLGNNPVPLRRFKLLERLDRCGSASAQRVV